MKKALIVKEDGLIYVGEVPEEPKFGNPIYEGVRTELIRRDYQRALASAKDSAILVSDQEKAIGILMLHVDHLIHKRPALKPGIYPIPDLQWKVDLTHLVAILKESTPSETESQEELWSAIEDIVEDKIGKYYVDLPTGQLTFNIVEELKEHFTITRKK